MNVVIIEDEHLAAKRMTDLLNRFDKDIKILDTLPTIKRSVNWFSENHQPDLVFMDIQLADGLSFDIFERIEIKCPIIFTTAYDEYALKAFKVNSIDYLLKPIDYNELGKAMKKFYTNYSQYKTETNPEIITNLLRNFQNNKYKTRFLIKVGIHLKNIEVNDIACFYSLKKATYLSTYDNRSYNIDHSLEQLEELLDPKKFFRINRKYIANLTSFIDIMSFKNSRLKVKMKGTNDDDIFVSRDKVQKFKRWLDN